MELNIVVCLVVCLVVRFSSNLSVCCTVRFHRTSKTLKFYLFYFSFPADPSDYSQQWDNWFGPSGRNETAPETDLTLLLQQVGADKVHV